MSKNITELDSKNFDNFIKDGKAVIDFWAQWCAPCRIMAPIFEKVAENLKGKVKFGKVDVDKNMSLAQRFQVMSIPTTIFFKNKEQVDRAVGTIPKEELIKRIKEIK